MIQRYLNLHMVPITDTQQQVIFYRFVVVKKVVNVNRLNSQRSRVF